ncbi:MAG: family 20 glycosylhydrolase [Chlorobi bacterium]|nr:family 20 glycosylhydrolase [Chlorobiota bacterium]
MNRNTLFLLATLFLITGCGKSHPDRLPEVFRIIPQPRKVEMLKGKGLRHGMLKSVDPGNLGKRPVMGIILDRLPESSAGVRGVLSLVIDSTMEETDQPEGYVLTVSNNHAEIRAPGEAGIFYGCQTLEQLLEDAGDYSTSIPACRITDYPAMSYRAVHFDVKHHLDHMNYYYESIDRLARYKINAVIFEFEDKLRYRRQPPVGAPQAVSIDEMAALTGYAADRHIEISPLVQGLGHATFILKHKEYAHLREIPDKRWVFCPADEGTYKVLFDNYLDAMEATPGSKYLHIGGDEIGDIGTCPRCKPVADRNGIMSLNLYWLNRVCKFITAHGRIPMFWDDMPLKEAGVYQSTWDIKMNEKEAEQVWQRGEEKLDSLIPEFPKNCVYMRWNYERGRLPGNIKALEWYQKNHLPVMVSTAAQTGAMLFPKDQRTGSMSDGGLVAIQSFLRLAVEKGIDGMFCTAWDDKSPHFETYWRGLIAAAEYSWSPDGRTLEDFDKAYLQREYAVSDTNYYSFYRLLREAALFWRDAYMRNGSRTDLQNALINLPGLAHWIPEEEKEKQKHKTDFTDLLIELPDAGHPGAWKEKYKERLEKAEKVLKDYEITSEKIRNFKSRSKRNRYHWEVFAAINDFQVSAPKILLALKACDTSDDQQRRKGYENLQGALDYFHGAWENLERVYGKTRFTAYPPDYVPDRYFHYASQREDLTWMIQVEDLFQKMIDSRMIH